MEKKEKQEYKKKTFYQKLQEWAKAASNATNGPWNHKPQR